MDKNKKEQIGLIAGLVVVILLLIATILFFIFGTVTIDFNANGGSNVNYIRIVKGKTAILPTTTREGYKFVGWYNGEELIDENTPIDKDAHLVAKWEEEIKSYTITFDTKGGNELAQLVFNENSKVTLPKPTRKGYKFVAWLDENGKTVKSGVLESKDMTLSAKWKKK